MLNERRIIILADASKDCAPTDLLNQGSVSFKRGDNLKIEAILLNKETLINPADLESVTLEVLDIGALNAPEPREVKLLMRKTVSDFCLPSKTEDGSFDFENGSSTAIFEFSSDETLVPKNPKWLRIVADGKNGKRVTFVSGWIFIEENFGSEPSIMPTKSPLYYDKAEIENIVSEIYERTLTLNPDGSVAEGKNLIGANKILTSDNFSLGNFPQEIESLDARYNASLEMGEGLVGKTYTNKNSSSISVDEVWLERKVNKSLEEKVEIKSEEALADISAQKDSAITELSAKISEELNLGLNKFEKEIQRGLEKFDEALENAIPIVDAEGLVGVQTKRIDESLRRFKSIGEFITDGGYAVQISSSEAISFEMPFTICGTIKVEAFKSGDTLSSPPFVLAKDGNNYSRFVFDPTQADANGRCSLWNTVTGGSRNKIALPDIKLGEYLSFVCVFNNLNKSKIILNKIELSKFDSNDIGTFPEGIAGRFKIGTVIETGASTGRFAYSRIKFFNFDISEADSPYTPEQYCEGIDEPPELLKATSGKRCMLSLEDSASGYLLRDKSVNQRHLLITPNYPSYHTNEKDEFVNNCTDVWTATGSKMLFHATQKVLPDNCQIDASFTADVACTLTVKNGAGTAIGSLNLSANIPQNLTTFFNMSDGKLMLTSSIANVTIKSNLKIRKL